jgi:CubicO group peptidase (beta-lactamase class C family)
MNNNTSLKSIKSESNFSDFCFVVLLLLGFTGFGQTNYTGKIDEYMKAEADIYNFSGTVLVKKNNKIIYLKAFGLADLEWNVPITMDTKFRICSISKTFSSACILILEQEGKLSVSDKLSKYIKDFPKGDKVTLHMMLSNTSGIADYVQNEFPDEKDTIISAIKKSKYTFEPGTDYEYSNSNYFLLAYIVEQVSKQTYTSFINQHIFSKANMTNTLVDNFDTIVPKRAVGYYPEKNYYVHEDNHYLPNAMGTGDILSTVEDLSKWDDALNGNSILNEKSKAKMFTSYNTKEPYGYGFNVWTFQNKKIFQKTGGDGGFKTSFLKMPNDSICVIALSNNMSNSVIISFAIAAMLNNDNVSLSKKHIEKSIDTTILKKYVGVYKENYMGISIELKIIAKNGKLYEYINENNRELIPESETSFLYPDRQDRQLEFETDAKGNVIKAWKTNAGLKAELVKQK